jgi:carbamoyltransferase
MIILGYSGLDASVRFAKQDPNLRVGEERIVQGLDSAAAIIVNGEVVAAAAEERFCGEKHTNRFPVESIRYCMKAAGVTPRDINAVAHGFDYRRYAGIFRAFQRERYGAVYDPDRQRELWQEHFNVSLGEQYYPRTQQFQSVGHHLAHAASTYFPSGFKDALCAIFDGMGETESATIYSVKDGEFRVLDRHTIDNSLGILYGLVTYYLGFKFNADEYKVMGLAPYGHPSKYRDFFNRLIKLDNAPKYRVWGLNDAEPYYRNLMAQFEKEIPRPSDTEMLPQEHCDFAAAAQGALERAMFHVITYWQKETWHKNLCMAGGVALNCTFNGKLWQRGLFEQIHIQPAAGDDGTALGAALVTAHQQGDTLSPSIVHAMPFYGPSYSKTEIAAATRFFGLDVTDLGSEEAAADDAAEALANNEIVAWFQGRMEYGPRALGNRSILANPLVPDIKDKLNRLIKLREGFRPFAPAVATGWAHDYFDFSPSSMFDYMLAVCPVLEEWRGRLPGITHVDGSARMQTVDDRNPLFHRLITAFGRHTGVYCVVNTSFNLQGQPIIVSPEIAIQTFRKVAFDRLYMGPFRCKK